MRIAYKTGTVKYTPGHLWVRRLHDAVLDKHRPRFEKHAKQASTYPWNTSGERKCGFVRPLVCRKKPPRSGSCLKLHKWAGSELASFLKVSTFKLLAWGLAGARCTPKHYVSKTVNTKWWHKGAATFFTKPRLVACFSSVNQLSFSNKDTQFRVSRDLYSRHILYSICGYPQVGQPVNPACSTKQHLSCIFMPSDICY